MAAVLFVTIAIAAAVSGVIIHYLWSGLGLVPPSGEAGGTAPHGYTLYLNAVFTLVFAAQLWVTFGPGESAGGDSVPHEHAH